MEESKLLHRQIHPNFVKNNTISVQAFEVTSQAFQTFAKDNGLLSVFNGKMFTAQESFDYYTNELELKSFGVLSISREECKSIELTVIDDNHPFEGHSSVDMKELSQNQMKKKASQLKQFAMDRGWMYKN